jgi:ribosomal protein S18 acetylase RimI-like enzyme
MKIKIFGNKKIKIRKISRKDLKNVRKFQEYINSLVKESAQIQKNKKATLKEEKEWIKSRLKKAGNRQEVTLVAEYEGEIIGSASIKLDWGRQSHVGHFGISIRKGYRRMGLGTYLTKEIIKLAKKELKPSPKMIRLSVFSTNKPAIAFYKKLGFKKVAQIPKQIKFMDKLVDEIIMLLELN